MAEPWRIPSVRLGQRSMRDRLEWAINDAIGALIGCFTASEEGTWTRAAEARIDFYLACHPLRLFRGHEE